MNFINLYYEKKVIISNLRIKQVISKLLNLDFILAITLGTKLLTRINTLKEISISLYKISYNLYCININIKINI